MVLLRGSDAVLYMCTHVHYYDTYTMLYAYLYNVILLLHIRTYYTIIVYVWLHMRMILYNTMYYVRIYVYYAEHRGGAVMQSCVLMLSVCCLMKPFQGVFD